MSADQAIGEVRAPSVANLGAPSVLRVDPATNTLAVVGAGGNMTPPTDVTATGTLTNATDTVSVATTGCGQVAITAKGGAGANQMIVIEGRVFGSAVFTAIMAFDPSLSNAPSTNIQSANNLNQTRVVPCAGFDLVQVRCTAATVGATTVFLEASAAAPDSGLNDLDNYEPAVLLNVAATGTGQISTTPTRLCSMMLTNRNAGVRYFQIFNQSAALAGGEANFLPFAVGPQQTIYIGKEILAHLKMTVAMVYGWSTTQATYTAATAGEHDAWILGRKVPA